MTAHCETAVQEMMRPKFVTGFGIAIEILVH